MVLLGCSNVFCVVARVFWVVAMRLLRYFGWLLGYSNVFGAVANVFLVVARKF